MRNQKELIKIAQQSVAQLEEAICELLRRNKAGINGLDIGKELENNFPYGNKGNLGYFQGCLLKKLEEEGKVTCKKLGSENIWNIK